MSDYDPADLVVDSYPHARKDHTCDTCLNTIKRGEVYWNSKMLYDGYFTTYKTCMFCRSLWLKCLEYEDTAYLGQGMIEQIREIDEMREELKELEARMVCPPLEERR